MSESEAAVRAAHCWRESTLTLERAILGLALLSRPANAALMVGMLTEEDFLGPFHKAVFKAIRGLALRNQLGGGYADLIAELQRQGTYEQFENALLKVCELGEHIAIGRRSMLGRCEEIKQLAQERARRRALERALKDQ